MSLSIDSMPTPSDRESPALHPFGIWQTLTVFGGFAVWLLALARWLTPAAQARLPGEPIIAWFLVSSLGLFAPNGPGFIAMAFGLV